MSLLLPEANFGEVGPVDWRESIRDDEDDEDSLDDENVPTDTVVVAMLGFDPADDEDLGKAYDPDQPRDGRGRFSSGGGSRDSAQVPPRDDQAKAADGLREFAAMVAGVQGKGPAAIVSDSGRAYHFEEDSFGGSKRTQGKCYQEAGRAALADPSLTYVEGYVSVHGVPIEHAWTADSSGKVWDSTLKDSAGIKGYFGVPFKTDYLRETILRTKVWGLLFDTNREIFGKDSGEYVAKLAKGVEDEQRDERGRWTSSGGSSSADDIKVAVVRATFGQKLLEGQAVDVAQSWLKNGPIDGHGLDDPFWMRYALQAKGIDSNKISDYSDGQIKDALSGNYKDQVQWTGRGTMSGLSDIVDQVRSESGQMKIANAIVEASGNEKSWAVENNRVSPIEQAVSGVRGYRGDVLDSLADRFVTPAGEELPYGLRMYSKDYETAAKSFLNNWRIMGGTEAYMRAYAALKDVDGNRSVSEFWTGKSRNEQFDASKNEGMKVPSQNLKETLTRMYDETQKFYQAKFATKADPTPDLSQRFVEVQRGVGGFPDAYTPAPVESWTTDARTPDKFGKMMGTGRYGNEYSVLTASVPYSSVFWTHKTIESLGFTGDNGEKAVKGKKEFAIFGGALRDVKIRRSYDD